MIEETLQSGPIARNTAKGLMHPWRRLKQKHAITGSHGGRGTMSSSATRPDKDGHSEGSLRPLDPVPRRGVTIGHRHFLKGA